jgi:hypothetical protein
MGEQGARPCPRDTEPRTLAELERALPGKYDHIQQWHHDWLRTIRIAPPAQPLCLVRGNGS